MILRNIQRVNEITDDLKLELLKEKKQLSAAIYIINLELKNKRKDCTKLGQLNRNLEKVHRRRVVLISLDDKLELTKTQIANKYREKIGIETKNDIKSLKKSVEFIIHNKQKSADIFDKAKIDSFEKISQIENFVDGIKKLDLRTEIVENLFVELQKETDFFNEATTRYAKLLCNSTEVYGGGSFQVLTRS